MRAFVLHPRVPVCVCVCVWQYTVDVGHPCHLCHKISSTPPRLTRTRARPSLCFRLFWWWTSDPELKKRERDGESEMGEQFSVFEQHDKETGWILMIWDAFVHPRVFKCECQKPQVSFLTERHSRSFQVIWKVFLKLKSAKWKVLRNWNLPSRKLRLLGASVIKPLVSHLRYRIVETLCGVRTCGEFIITINRWNQ